MFKYSAEEDATRLLSLDESSALLPENETAKSSKIVRQPAASVMNKLQNSLGIDTSPYDSVSRVEEEDRLDGCPVRKRPRQKNRRQFTWRLLSVMAFAAFGFFAGVFVENLKLQSTSRSQDSSEDVCMDPIQALKPSSYLDSLPNGAVAADHIVCSQTGNEILQKGGNAVDAAVATVLCLGVANPASSGLGGGAFLLIHSDRKHYESKDPNTFPPFDDQRSDSDEDEKEDLDKITEVIDCRETAPESASQDMFSDQPQDASSIGGLAVAIPGELRGLELAHSRHGKLNWASVVEPAIHLARDGVTISPHLARDIRDVAKKVKAMGLNFPELRRFLTMNDDDDWDNYLKAGKLLKNPQLAKTLEIIAKEGSKGFYTQQIAENLVNDVQSAGGIISMTDLEQYLPTLRSPLHADVNGYTIVGVPPPSSGGATIIGAARFLSGYQMPLAGAADTLSIHRMVEALRHAFSIRMSLSDPAFRANVTLAAVQDLVAGSYMESLRKTSKDDTTLSISKYGGEKWAQMNDHEVQVNDDIADAHEGDRRLLRRLARRFGYLEDNGTSHLSAVDKDGNAVAITTSVNQIFGSYVFSESTGVLLGNTMDDFGVPGRSNYFGLKPSAANFISPGKKPLSSMSPTLVLRREESGNGWGKLMLVVGGSGGPKIISAVLQVIINYCFLGMNLYDSIVTPRIHEQLVYHDAAVTTVEKDKLDQGPTIEVSKRTKSALTSRGHKLLDIDYAGTVQAVGVDLETKLLSAVSDIRKGGTPAGH